jgi:uncharacterized protein
MSPTYLLGLSVALHFYIGARLLPALAGTFAPATLALLLMVSALLVPMGVLARRMMRPPAADTVAALGLLFMGLFSSLLVLTVLRDALLLLAGVVGLFAPSAVTLGPLRSGSADAVPLLALGLSLLGYLNARRTARVVTVEVAVPELPAALDGFTIVQISDIHVGLTIRHRYVESIVEAVNRLNPDLVAITGDLVDGTVPELASEVAPLARLVSRHGSFFVSGNHEYYSGVGPWLAEIARLGIKVLQNEHVLIVREGSKLVLAGVPDYSAGHFDSTHRSDPEAALAGAPPDAAVRILLAHQPRTAFAAERAGFDLQLSGHTHGGQFMPWNFFIKLQQPFTAGLYRVGRLQVYVSRGTGYWGPPKRIGAPSEITQLRLKASRQEPG